MAQFVFVSFDVTSHAAESNHAKQVERIATLNDIVKAAIHEPESGEPMWASGGDGGHIAYTPAGAISGVPYIVRKLRNWSVKFAIALRIVAHIGVSSTVPGADGRMQLVGDGINLCGSLLEVACIDAIIVTASFAELFKTIPGSGLRFHDSRNVYLKHFRMTEVYLCSLEGEPSSFWMPLHRSDRTLLSDAMKAGAPWDVIYYARRIIQMNSGDTEATTAIANTILGRYGDLIPKKKGLSNHRAPFFSSIDAASLLSFVVAAELIERRDGDVLCNQDDPGDTMFIVLRGELALVIAASKTDNVALSTIEYSDDSTFGPGDVVGELALALKTKRTATLQAIGAASLLSFSYQKLREFVMRHSRNAEFSQSLSSFLALRVLDYVCKRADYLVGLDRSRRGPLSGVNQPWEWLRGYFRRFDFSVGEQFDASDERFADPGLYILASGTVAKSTFGRLAAKHVDGFTLSPVFLDFPNRLVNRFATYDIRSPSATLVHIQDAGFSQWGPDVRDQIITHLSRAVARTFEYDIFISFAVEDYELALKIKSVLVAKQLTVYLDAVTPGKGFSQYLAGVIVSSLLFVVLNTPLLEYKEKTNQKTWVEREVTFRKEAFSGEHGLLPLRVDGSRIVDCLAGISNIDIFSTFELSSTFEPSFVPVIRSLVEDIKEGRVIVPSARLPRVRPSLTG